MAIAAAIAAIGLCALILPDLVLDLMPGCLITRVLHVWCPGCGMTHAAIALLHGDAAGAWRSNKLSFIVLPLLGWLYIQYVRMVWRTYRPRTPRSYATTPSGNP